jgi:YesN/AraC family two-component response regulator
MLMKTILVIEDEVQTLNIFLRCLEFEGFRAYGAKGGAEGIELARSCQPDLIVCDILMPDLDGYGVLSTLRRSPQTAGIPFIFLTAKVTMVDLRQGMELGADDYLTKPCTVEQFLAAIATRLQRHEDLRQFPQEGQSNSPPNSVVNQSIAEFTNPETWFPQCNHLGNLETVFQFIEAHYQEPLKLEDVAKAAGYAPAYLTNLIQKETGRSIKQWIIERRMRQARQLLQNTTESVCKVAELSGYPDPGYFSSQFRRLHGISPLVWRKKVRGKTQGDRLAIHAQ